MTAAGSLCRLENLVLGLLAVNAAEDMHSEIADGANLVRVSPPLFDLL